MDEARILSAAGSRGYRIHLLEARKKLLNVSRPEVLEEELRNADVRVLVNRCRLGQRRRDVAELYSDLTQVINPSHVESICQDKLYFYNTLSKSKIPTPSTMSILYSTETGEESKIAGKALNEELEDVGKSFLRELRISSGRRVIFKLRSGTHAHGMIVVNNLTQLVRVLSQRLRRTPGNPLGYLLQQFYEKPFDFRLVVRWRSDGSKKFCGCLLRSATSDEEAATSTARGMPSVGLPSRRLSELAKLAFQVVDAVKEPASPGVLGIDVLPVVENNLLRRKAYGFARELKPFYAKINRARNAILELNGRWSDKALREFDARAAPLFRKMRKVKAYEALASIGCDVAENARLLVLDGNTCVDYAQNTYYNCGVDLFQEYVRASGIR